MATYSRVAGGKLKSTKSAAAFFKIAIGSRFGVKAEDIFMSWMAIANSPSGFTMHVYWPVFASLIRTQFSLIAFVEDLKTHVNLK